MVAKQAWIGRPGSKLLCIAVLIEVVAVCVGLGLALVQGVDASRGVDGSIPWLTVLLASGGFLIASCAEIGKIPVASALVGAPWRWRVPLAVFLLVMTVITFETVFFSLERGFTLRMQSVEEQRRAVARLASERAAAEVQRDDLGDAAQEQGRRLDERLAILRQGLTARTAAIEAELRRLDEARLSPEQRELQRQEALLADERAQRLADRDRQAREITERFESQRESYVTRIAQARADGDLATVRRQEAELARLPGPGARIDRIRAETTAETTRIDEALADLRRRMGQIVVTADPAGEQRRATLRGQLDGARAELLAIDQKAAEQAERQLADGMRQLDEGLALEARLAGLDTAIAAGAAKLADLAELSQVHRIAASWHGKPAGEVSSQEAKGVATAWFGSIAVIAALTGSTLAIIAAAQARVAEPRPAVRPRMSLKRYLHRWLVKRLYQPRTVVRAVDRPVEVIVEKPVEVMVENEVKTFVYVPVPTTDPETVMRDMVRDYPPEVIDLVRLKMQGAAHDRAA